jgi:hypothetical protein
MEKGEMNTSKDGKVKPRFIGAAPREERFSYLPGVKESEFLMAKGTAFKAHWMSKFKNGVTKAEIARFERLVAEFHGTVEW